MVGHFVSSTLEPTTFFMSSLAGKRWPPLSPFLLTSSWNINIWSRFCWYSARMVGVRTHHKAFCLLCGFCTYLVRVHRWGDWGVFLRLPVHSLIDQFQIDLHEPPGGVEVAGNGASDKRSQGHLLLLRHFDFVSCHLLWLQPTVLPNLIIKVFLSDQTLICG